VTLPFGFDSPIFFKARISQSPTPTPTAISLRGHFIMPAQNKSDSSSLKTHDIYFEKLTALDSCPADLQQLLKQVIGIRDLKSDHFGGYEANHFNHSVPEFTPRQQYERELKHEADELRSLCCDSRRADDNEDKWVKVLEPIVFYRFDREGEERYSRDRHQHW
jgi:hypothetical protein